ncbi:MAG: murein biosynthesis integral membrane protein MurJ [Phycisphaerae bacterium]|nr:murein biosynthesis integral membrane protein MurJ [Phycisphaerae bacterium]
MEATDNNRPATDGERRDHTQRDRQQRDGEHKEREHFFGAAKLMGVLTVLSRIAGMARAMAMANFGANALTDAFTMAFQIPNLFRRLFAEGALSAAFVPVFTQTLQEADGADKARRLLANAMGLLALLMVGLMVLIQLGLLAWWCWPVLTGGEALAPKYRLMIQMLAVMLPFMVTICLLALASAALNCRGHFWYPASAPVLLNLVIIAASLLAFYAGDGDAHPWQLLIISASVSVAGVLQLVGVYWLLKRTGFPLGVMLRPIQPGIGQIARLMGPVVLGLGFFQLSELLASVLAMALAGPGGPLEEGVLVRLANARLLYQFPMGVLAISLGVAVFPLLSRYAARGDMENLRHSINRAVRLSFMEGLASGAGLFLLAVPITRLLFRQGAYGDEDVLATAFILQTYAVGMWAYCTYQIIVRAFYATKDTRTPLILSCVLQVVQLGLAFSLVWVGWLNAGAFGVATAVTFTINTVLLGVFLRRRLGRLGGRSMAVSAVRSLVATAAMAGVLHGMLALLESQGITGATRGQCGLIVAIAVPAGGLTFIAVAAALRAPELGELAGPILQRLRRRVTSDE